MLLPNITMAAFRRGTKPASLVRLLNDIIGEIKRLMKRYRKAIFKPYDLYQIHATIIGMEAVVIDGKLYNHWFLENKKELRLINIQRFLDLIKRVSQRNPLFTIRFGCFEKACCTCVGESSYGWNCATSDSEFHSCDNSAYEGSFYAYSRGDVRDVILTGWPVKGPDELHVFPHFLYDFRLAAEDAGFLDKYHGNKYPHWKDDDCFIKLGIFRGKMTYEQLRRVEERVRDYLYKYKRGPVTVDIRVKDVSILLYKDPSLGKGCMIECVPLVEALDDPTRVRDLYRKAFGILPP